MDATEYLKKAIDLAGGQTELAERINQHIPPSVQKVKQANIWSWLNRSHRVPSEYAIPLQLAVDSEVTAMQVCPDTFRPDIADLVIREASVA